MTVFHPLDYCFSLTGTEITDINCLASLLRRQICRQWLYSKISAEQSWKVWMPGYIFSDKYLNITAIPVLGFLWTGFDAVLIRFYLNSCNTCLKSKNILISECSVYQQTKHLVIRVSLKRVQATTPPIVFSFIVHGVSIPESTIKAASAALKKVGAHSANAINAVLLHFVEQLGLFFTMSLIY